MPSINELPQLAARVRGPQTARMKGGCADYTDEVNECAAEADADAMRMWLSADWMQMRMRMLTPMPTPMPTPVLMLTPTWSGTNRSVLHQHLHVRRGRDL